MTPHPLPFARRAAHGAADRVVVIGLDCASPWLLLERWRDAMPRLDALARRGVAGTLRSCDPPITVPAWRVMASGQDAGLQGVYGFRNRSGWGYDALRVASSADFQGEPLWARLGARGLRTTLLGLPGTWPPPDLRGACISGPLTPDLSAACAAPRELAEWLRQRWPTYAFDVADHRLMDPEALLDAVEAMTRTRQEVALALAARDDWNLLWSVEIGLDRLYHALWHHIDPAHPRYQPGSPLEARLRDYHALLDRGIGALVDALDDGETTFLVVSDHGARPMLGGFCINQWLIDHGWLVLKAPLPHPARLTLDQVDWSRTRAWATGGYVGRVFLNLQGREPLGIVPPAEAAQTLARLRAQLEGIALPDGTPMRNVAFPPHERLTTPRGFPPDLLVVFADLAWRGLDTVGGPTFTAANDTGADSANHAWEGVFVAAGAGISPQGAAQGMRLLDVAPLIELLLTGAAGPSGPR